MSSPKHHHPFDEAVRQKLADWTPPHPPQGWDKMERRLANAEQAARFDEAISHSVKRASVPAMGSSWERLAARLVLERQRVQAIWQSKAIEALFFIILIGWIWPQIPGLEEAPAPVQANSLLELAEVQQPPVSPIIPNHSSAANTDKSATNAAKETAASTVIKFSKTSSDNLLFSQFSAKELTYTGIRPLSQRSSIGKVAAVGQIDRQDVPGWQPAQRQGQVAVLQVLQPAIAMADDSRFLKTLARTALKKKTLRIGFMTSMDVNRIITPEQKIGDVIYSADRFELGYSGGISVGIERRRWEFETGLQYAARPYAAPRIVEISGSVAEGNLTAKGLDRIELNTATVPLHWRYNFSVDKSWRLYAQTGVSLNVVWQSNYYVEEKFEKENDRRYPNQGRSAEIQSLTIADNQVKGILEGGSFWQNASLYGDVALGIENYINPRTSIYVQPTFQHSIQLFNSGLGPYYDKINSLSLRVGAKVRL